MPDKIDQLFDDLQSRGYAKDKTRKQFRDYMLAPGKQGYENRRTFFEDFKSNGETSLGSYEDFKGLLGLHATKQQRQNAPSVYQKAQGGGGLGRAMKSVSAKVQQSRAVGQPQAKVQQEPQNYIARPDSYTSPGSLVGQLEKRDEQAETAMMQPLRDISKKVEDRSFTPQRAGTQYVDEEGNVVKDETYDVYPLMPQEVAEDLQNRAAYEEMTSRLDEQLKEAYAEQERLKGAINKRGGELYDKSRREEEEKSLGRRILEGFTAGDADFGAGRPRDYGTMSDSDYQTLQSALRQNERRIKALEAAKEKAGFWRGTGNVLTDPSSYSFGLTDLADASALANVKTKIDTAKKNGTAPNLTEGEKALAHDYLQKEEAEQMNEDNWWYNAGQGFGETVSFMKDFLMSGGGYANIAKAGMRMGAKGGAKLAAKAFGEYSTKNLGTKVLGKTIEYIGKGAGLAAGAEAGGFLLNNTVQAASSAADIMNRQTGNLTYDKDGNLTVEGGKSLGEAILTSQIARTGQNASELVGIAFDAMPGILGRVIQRTTAGKVLKRITDSKFWKKGENALDYLGVQSVWGEGMEEEYGMARDEILNRLTNNAYMPEGSGLFDLERQLDTWKTVGLTSGILRVPSMIVSGTQSANYYANKYNLNASGRQMRSTFGDEARYQAVKTVLDEADNKDISKVLNNILKDNDLSQEEKQSAFIYANDLIKMRGFNIGSVVAAANGYQAPPRVAGYNIKGNTVEEVDENGNVLETHEYDSREEMKAGLFGLQQERYDKNLQSDISVMKTRPGGQYGAMVEQYCKEAGIDVEEFEEMLNKPSMERTDAEQQIVTPFAELLHGAVYDNTTLHEEQSQQDGEETADADSIDIEDGSEQGAIIGSEWASAQENRQRLFEKNEELKQEVELMESQGLSHQEIISRLETFSPEDVQSLIDYYNTEAKFNGYINRKSQKIDEEAAYLRDSHTFKGTINGQADVQNVHKITDGVNEYYLVSGNVTTDSSGKITGSTSGLIIGMDLDGSFVQLNDADGYSVMPVDQTLDQYEEAERIRLQQQVTSVIDPNGALRPQGAATASPQSGQATENGAQPAVEAGQEQTGADEAAGETPIEQPTPNPSVEGNPSAVAATPSQQRGQQGGQEGGTALDRIPKDEKGNPLYEQASAEDTYDALLEQVGNKDTARVLVQNQVNKAKERLNKLQKKMEKGDFEGDSFQEQIESSKKLQQSINEEEGRIKYWTSVLTVPQKRMLKSEPAAPAKTAEPETPATEAPATETPSGEVPEWRYDTPEAARERGYKIIEGNRVDRQEEKDMPKGMEVEVQYSTKDKVKGRMTVSELGDVQGSHLTNGQRNERHFLPEAQPKSEFGADRQAAAQANASEENFRPELTLTFNGTQSAYSGSASQTNRRGEVIQGNGRRNLAEYIYAPGNEAVAKKYKEFLMAHAEELGTTAEEIAKMEKPFAHIVLDVSDEEAIRLGQFTAQDLESGGKKVPEVSTVTTKLGDKYSSLANIILKHDDPDASLADRIDANAEEAVKWLNNGGFINNTEAKTLLEDKALCRQFIKDLITDQLFKDAHPDLRTMFYELPKNIQSAIISVVGREVAISEDKSILKDIQESIRAYHELTVSSPEFANATGSNFEKRYAVVTAAVNDWLRQINIDGTVNSEKFSNFALGLAKLYKSLKDQKTLAGKLREYYDLASGTPRELGIFDAPASAEPMSKEEIIKQIFGIEYGRQRTVPVAGDNQEGETGSEGGASHPQSGEPKQEGAGQADNRGGDTVDAEVGDTATRPEGQETAQSTEEYLASHPLTEEQIMADTEANEDEKLNAIDFLRGEDDSAISRFYYDGIYNRSNRSVQNNANTSGTSADPLQAMEKAAKSFREEQKSKDQQDIDDALKEFNDFLDNAKGSNVLDAFMRKGLEGNDKLQASLLDAFTLTNEAQRMFLKDLLRLASKIGYAYLKKGVHDAQAWSRQMTDSIGKKLNETLGWDDAIVGEFVDEVWNQKYTVDGQRMRMSEHAERLKNDKGADTAVNVNKNENNVTENVVSSQQEAAKPQLEGDSAEYAERQEKIKNLSDEIAKTLRKSSSINGTRLTFQYYKALAKTEGIDNLSDTDLQELIEAEIVNLAREITNGNEESEEQKYQHIVRLYENQPSLNVRDNDRVNLQQYSTPAPMAFLMGTFCRSGRSNQSGLRGLEPSAGNGMLTIGLPKEGMHVNDIDEMRLSNLQKQGFGEVTSQDGTLPFGDKQYDVIVTNPPFGNVTPKVYDGIYEISGLEHQMAINALESMKDDGRAAIIIGGNTEYNTNGTIKGKDRVFLNYLYAHYNVVDVINMDGKTLYSRQGTGFPVRMILINGRKEYNPKDFAPVQSKARAEQVKSYDELYKRVNDDILLNENKSAGVHNTESGESGRVDDSSNAGNAPQTGVRDVRADGGEGQPSVRSTGGRGVQRSDSSANGTDRGVEPSMDTRPSGVEGGSVSSQSSGSATAQAEEQRGLFDRRDDTERPSAESVESSGGRRSPRLDNTHRVLGEEKVPYRQQSNNPYSLQSQMPAEQADVVKKALEDLGDVDTFLVKELGYSSVDDMHHGSQSPDNHGGLAAEQIDSVAMAIHQMNQGNAFIIGDQTGIGKGRQAAALIRYGVKKGGCPVFITVKKALFSDMYRDLCDIGSPDLKPFIWSADDAQHSGAVTDKDGNVIYEMPSKKEQERVVEYINKYGKLPPEYDYVLTTYDSFKSGTMDYEGGQKKARQFPRGKKPSAVHYNGQAKRDALEALASSSYVIMDESHNAGGEGSNVSGYLQYITSKAKGITFLSATFAKRPGNMPIYSLKTAISKAGVAVGELIDAVKSGGATFQEIMSKALTEAGQMIRRERDMTGVTIDWKGIEDEAVIEKQREQYDQVISLFNDIIGFQRTYVDPMIDGMNDAAADSQGEVNHTPGTRDMGINNTPFASRTYNIVQQVLLSLKAEEAAKRAIEHLKAGHKPVITVANTNEGAADEVAAAGGESMEMPDLSVNLKKGLRGTLRFTEKDAFGNTTNREIPFESLSPEGQARYREIMDAIENASTGLSLSPIDVIKNELKKAGYKVGELTGRQSEFVYNEDGTVKRVKRTGTDKKKVASDFNNGRLDALILNKSAGTGISLHASTKFDDQRQRVMIVAQAQGDVNDEVQIRGRIDRTGQVLRGMYEYIVSQIPSEQRLLMMLKAKLRSLDANTTSSQKSKFNEMDVQDIINKYGDDIVIQYLAEHPDLADKMCNPLKWKGDWQVMSSEQLVKEAEKSGEAGQTASKVLGRMALLSVKEQEKMLSEIGELYQAEIDRLNEMGENDLEITEMPLKAKTLAKTIWEQGIEPGGKNPFADNSYIEKVQMDVLKKPMKGDEVKRAQAHLLGGKTWEEYKADTLAKVDKWAEDKKKEATETITARAEKKAKAEQERYVKAAKKAQEKNGLSDAEIERNGEIQYKNIYQQEIDKLDDSLKAIEKQKQVFVDALELFNTDKVYAIPSNIYDLGGITFEPGMGKLIDIKISDNFSTNASTLSFATLDGRRKITIPVSGMVKQQNDEKRSVFPAIMSLTAQTKNGMFGSNVANTLKVLEQNIDNWDKLTSSAARKDGYIITGNLLKALVSTREQHVGGKLISYTTDTGEVRQGILMPDNFEPGNLTSKTPISAMKDELRYSRDEVTSADGDVRVRVSNDWDWISRGYNTLELIVPKSKKKGEKYFNDKELLSLMDGQFEGSSRMKAEFKRANLDAVMKRLDELGVTVNEERKDNTSDTGRRYDEDIEGSDIAEKEVTNVIVDSTKTKLPHNRKEALEVVSKIPRPFINKDQGKEIIVYNSAVKHTATQGRSNADTQCLGVIDQIIAEAVKIGELPPKEGKEETIEKCEIYYCPVNIDGVQYSARLVVNQHKNRGFVLDDYQLYDLRTKEKSGAVSQATGQNALTSLSAPDSRYKVKDLIWNNKESDKNLIGINNRKTRFDEDEAATTSQHSEHKDRIAEHVDALVERLGTKERTTVYHSFDELPEADKEYIRSRERQGKKVRGWYENGHIYLYLPHIDSTYQAEKTIWHETVAHHGLRELVGAKNYDRLLRQLWLEHRDGDMGKWVAERMQQNGWNLNEAIDEYLAREAEKHPFEQPSLWQRLRWLLADALHKIGFATDPTISDIQYLFWVSQNRLREGDALSVAKQQAFLHRLERAAMQSPVNGRNNGERMYDEDIEEPLEHSAKAVYEDRLNRVETVFSEAYQDAMVSLKTAQNAIAKDKEIPDSQNAYMAENLMHGKNKNEQDLYNIEYRDPLIDTINKIMNVTGMNWGDVDRYVYTKSGLERNREFFVRDWLEAERGRTIRKYEDLNEEEQEIYDRKAASIETLFEDGDIDEAEKNKRLRMTLQEAHNEYVDDIESGWHRVKDERYSELRDNVITYPDYLSAMTDFIQQNIDESYDPSEHDYSGFRAMFGDAEGKYDEAAIIDELMDTEGQINGDDAADDVPTVDVLWEQIRKATRYGLERYREAGMRSDEQIDEVESMFHFYVPMRGFKEDKGEDMYQYFTGKGRTKSYVGGLLKHAKGRGSEAEYPISTIFAMTYKAISDCNQNMVNQKLYRLCQSNPNDLIVLSDSWAVLNTETGQWEESGPDIPTDATEEDVRQITLAWEDEMRRLSLEGKAKKITGRPRFDYVPLDKEKKSEHEIDVRINGKPRKMFVVGNPRMAQALNGQLRFEKGRNVFSKLNAAIKNFMASLFTSYSPTFALRNMMRDWTHFRTMLGVREGEGYARQANKYYRQSLFKMVGLFKKYRNGTLDESKEIERDFKDFMDNGGITGYVFMQKIDDIQKSMEKLYKDQKEGKIIRLNDNLWMKILHAVETLNEGIENNARFATFRASRHYAGRTKARSAYDAKEITVNFNRKGAGGKTAGFKSDKRVVEDAAKVFGVSSQILGEGRIFFNATVQAIATTFKNFQNADGSLNKKYIAKWAGKYALPPFMFGLALPMINKMLAAALDGGDGDDDPYANLPEWTRRKNICIYVGNNNFITIPIGQELAAFLTLGDIFAGNTYAQELKPVDRDLGDEMVDVMNTFSPVDISTKITKGGMMEDPISEVTGRTFSVLAPLVAVEQNLSWTGRPIYREDKFKNDKYVPEYQMVYSSTNPVMVSASQMLHELGGGNDRARGKEWSEVNPAIIQYLWEQYTGGPGKVFSNTISIGKDVKDYVSGKGSDFNIRKVEGIKAFIQQGDDRTQYYRAQSKFYKYQEDADKFKYDHDVSGLEKQAKTDPAAKLELDSLMKTPEYQRYAIIKEVNRSSKKEGKVGLDELRKEIYRIADRKEKRAKMQTYNHLMKEVVDLLDQVGKE